jgi:hypothetical protein
MNPLVGLWSVIFDLRWLYAAKTTVQTQLFCRHTHTQAAGEPFPHRPLPNPRPRIGFVLRNSALGGLGVPTRHPPELGLFCIIAFCPQGPVPPGPAGIGFVSHNRPPRGAASQMSHPAQVWLCFAQSSLRKPLRLFELALFCTIGTGLEWWNGRILDPGRRHGSGVPVRPGLRKLASFCTFAPRPTPLGPRPTRRPRKIGFVSHGRHRLATSAHVCSFRFQIIHPRVYLGIECPSTLGPRCTNRAGILCMRDTATSHNSLCPKE